MEDNKKIEITEKVNKEYIKKLEETIKRDKRREIIPQEDRIPNYLNSRKGYLKSFGDIV